MIKYSKNTSKVVLGGWCCQATKHSNSRLGNQVVTLVIKPQPTFTTYTGLLNGYLLKSWQSGLGGRKGRSANLHAHLLHVIG